jgi:uncharacterized protein (TIGR02594 family)
MAKLPVAYRWLNDEPGPNELKKALELFGTLETPGKNNNPVIMGWADETNTTYPGDEVAWCGLFKSVIAKRAGWDYHPGGNALWARNWLLWGTKVETAMLGDTLIFRRGKGGHVALYVGEDETHYHILGGNQSDTVNIVRKAKTELLGIRRAKWKIAQPANVRPIFLSAKGAPVSTKEH